MLNFLHVTPKFVVFEFSVIVTADTSQVSDTNIRAVLDENLGPEVLYKGFLEKF